MRRAIIALAAVLRVSSVRADDVLDASDRDAALGRFEEAAATLEREAASHPPAAGAPSVRAWLERALEYRVALGDHPSALRDAQALARQVDDRDRAAEAELEAATVLTRGQRWTENARFHEAWLRRHAGASAGLRVRALVELGDALRATGGEARASVSYQRALDAAAALTDPTPVAPWLARARFWLAERAYRAFLARSFPRFPGGGRRAYDRWVQRVLTPFIQEQVRVLREDMTRQYTGVVNHHVPRWEVAAYNRLATMFYRFQQYIRTSPPPPDIARVPELLEAYNRCEGALRDCWEQPFVDTASEGFQRCLRTATNLREFNDYARECEAQLYAINRGRFPLADEFTPAPDQGL